MKNPKIVLVSEWDGWCGACAAERPLVLTRTGRQRLRTWLTGAADDSRPLVLTCRLCGTGVEVPLEQDDPPVAATRSEPEADTPAPLTVALQVSTAGPEPLVADATPPAAPAAELTAARQDVARALGALLTARAGQSTAPAAVPAPVAATVPVVVPAVAASVPLQRTASSGGLAELQLLADGIDLLSGGRP